MSAPAAGMSGEDMLIARYFRPLATHPGAFNLIDDVAILAPSGEDIVVTTDAIVEGVHFLTTDPPDTVACKALRVNLSDLAAKGAKPAGFLMTLVLRDNNDAWLAPFARALGEDAAAFECPLLGGDTTATPGPLMISITAFGRVAPGKMVRRSGAKVGDRIFVTGTIGDAALGLDILKNGKSAAALRDDPLSRDALIARYRIPMPRVVLAPVIGNHANAAMDVSDGLAGDLAKLCFASGVSARVEIGAVPLSPAARIGVTKGSLGMELVLAGGDDYEILCAVPENQGARFTAEASTAGVAVTEIGVIVEGTGLPMLVDENGRVISLPRLSYSHF